LLRNDKGYAQIETDKAVTNRLKARYKLSPSSIFFFEILLKIQNAAHRQLLPGGFTSPVVYYYL